MRLSHRDFDALQAGILELYAHRDREAFNRDLPGILLKLIPSDGFTRCDILVNPITGTAKNLGWEDQEQRPPHPDVVQYTEQNLIHHPFTKYFIGSGDPTALMLSDAYTLTQLRNTELYDRLYRPMGALRHLSISFPGSHGVNIGINFTGKGREFRERDRLILNLLQKHLLQACRNAEWVTQRLQKAAPPLASYGLTPRETEVARWLAVGKTNLEIAIIIGGKPRTVEKHVEKILEKLRVENRTVAAVLIAQALP
jgi:DNA-binding CsgD family transcriptional regulator